jgi:AraC family transcriptional regulator
MTRVLSGRLVSIDDWCCAGNDTIGRNAEWCGDDRIVITRRGLWELNIDDVPSLADSTTVTLWNRNTEYRVRHPIRGGDQCTIFRLTDAGVRALNEERELRGGTQCIVTFSRRALPLDGGAYLLHRTLLRAARRGDAKDDPIALEEPAFELIRRLCLDADREPESAEGYRDLVARVHEIISSGFAEPLSVEFIAKSVGCSPFHLSRIFRRATGLTLHRAIVRRRLREGLERLLDEPLHISRIALDVGFASHSHFTDAFRDEYGHSPQKVRLLAKSLT